MTGPARGGAWETLAVTCRTSRAGARHGRFRSSRCRLTSARRAYGQATSHRESAGIGLGSPGARVGRALTPVPCSRSSRMIMGLRPRLADMTAQAAHHA